RLMLRSRAHRARREGVTLQDKILGEPEWMGRLGGGAFSPLSNLMRKLRPAREVLHRTAGIHRDARLPEFAKEPFSAWYEKHAPSAEAGRKGRVALFTTCSYEWNAPRVARAAVEVLERNGLAVELPPQRCCGMPNLDGGDVAAATEKAAANVEALLPAVRRGLDVVVPGPT